MPVKSGNLFKVFNNKLRYFPFIAILLTDMLKVVVGKEKTSALPSLSLSRLEILVNLLSPSRGQFTVNANPILNL